MALGRRNNTIDYRSFVLLPGAVNARPGMYQMRGGRHYLVESKEQLSKRLSANARAFFPNSLPATSTANQNQMHERSRSLSPDANSFVPSGLLQTSGVQREPSPESTLLRSVSSQDSSVSPSRRPVKAAYKPPHRRNKRDHRMSSRSRSPEVERAFSYDYWTGSS
mmetsp:Transcript_19710/g.37982  ORF Transcript_19710/g.37982 Transcript_19710/m.37982 type:complete len:165 (-) Transcript_19710:387-881(-)